MYWKLCCVWCVLQHTRKVSAEEAKYSFIADLKSLCELFILFLFYITIGYIFPSFMSKLLFAFTM